MKVNGSKELTFDKEKVCKFGLMDLCTRDGFKTPKPTASEDLFTLMAMYTTVAGSMTRRTDKVFIAIWTGPSMREIGKKISSTDKVLRLGLTVLGTMDSTCLVRNMESENSHGLMAALTSETLKKITSKVMENITGPTVEYSKDLGSITRWKDKVYSRGLMVGDTRAITKMIRKKEMEPSIGQTVDSIKVAGKMVNNTVWEHTPQPLENPNKESGKTERDFTGSRMMALINEF